MLDPTKNKLAHNDCDKACHYSFHDYKIGIYGWRKKFLYALIILIATLVIINAALTIWIITMLNFSFGGIDRLEVYSGGIAIKGRTYIADKLFATTISSKKDDKLVVESDESVILKARDSSGNLVNKVVIGNSKVEATANEVSILGRNGQQLFLVNDDQILLATDVINIDNRFGIRFNASLQTPLVQSNAFADLTLISPSRRIIIKAPQSIAMESRAGDISSTCYRDLRFKSKQGKIVLDATHVVLQNLKSYETLSNPFPDEKHPDVYQLCLCGNNGKIFIAPAEGRCVANDNICRLTQKTKKVVNTQASRVASP